MQSGYVFWRILPDSGGGLAVWLCVCVCVWPCLGRGWVLWCLICCEDSSSRTQQSPGWPSRPAESDTSSLCLVLPRALTAGTWCWAASTFIITRTNHPQRAEVWGGTRLSVSPHCPPPAPLLTSIPLLPPPPALSLAPLQRDQTAALSLGSLIVFVPASRQIEFGLLQKKMPQLIWSYCPKEWPGLKG